MRIPHFCLPILVATVLTSPLFAGEIDAPDYHSTPSVETATVNWDRMALDESEAGQKADPQLPTPKSTETPSDPAKQNTGSGSTNKSANDQESHQRVLGLAPMFNVVNDASKARALTVREKWQLFYRQTYDPFQFVSAAFSAAINQAQDEFPEYGQGMAGYGKRYGAGFADNSLGAFFGNFALPSLLHDDPRYFRKGSGPFSNRFMHSVGASVITRRDNGTSRFNYSNVFGNLIGCAFGNLYYPKGDRGVGTTFERGFQVTAYGAVGGLFQEFWPDIQARVFKKHKAPDVR